MPVTGIGPCPGAVCSMLPEPRSRHLRGDRAETVCWRMTTPQQVEALASGRIGFDASGIDEPAIRHVLEEPLVAAPPAGTRCSATATLSLSASVAREPFGFYPASRAIADHAAGAVHGTEPA